MTIEKLSTTLFDLLANILPGYLLVYGISVVEATFFETSIFPFSIISREFLVFTILAYFLGQISHSLASCLKEWKFRWFTDKKNRLKPHIYQAVSQALIDAYSLKTDGIELDKLDTYVLAESYLLDDGEASERNSMIAREAFFKSSMVASAVLFSITIASLIENGLKVQIEPSNYSELGMIPTLIFGLLLFGTTALFRNRMMFFNRLKNNNVLLTFLAKYNQQKMSKEGQHG